MQSLATRPTSNDGTLPTRTSCPFTHPFPIIIWSDRVSTGSPHTKNPVTRSPRQLVAASPAQDPLSLSAHLSSLLLCICPQDI